MKDFKLNKKQFLVFVPDVDRKFRKIYNKVLNSSTFNKTITPKLKVPVGFNVDYVSNKEKYPPSTLSLGDLYMSNIVFNKEKCMASIYYVFICGGECGHSSIVLFRKLGKTWVIEKRKNLWIS